MNTVRKTNIQLLRPMKESDIPEVMAIEKRAYFEAWNKSFFRSCVRDGFSCWVLERDGAILGYGVMSLEEKNARIMNLCVQPDCQGQGLGRWILSHLLEQAHHSDADIAILEVRPSNHMAVKLYKSMGFADAGVEYTYYLTRTGWEDAVVMTLALKTKEPLINSSSDIPAKAGI